MTNNKPRILMLDLETSPNLAYVWGLWDQNISIKQLVESTEVICFGARWYGDETVEIRSVHIDGKAKMLERIWELMNEADAIAGWNSKGFDVKHLNREFLEAGMDPPSPHIDIDLMQKSKAAFRFPGAELCCTNCGSEDVQKRGYKFTGAGKFQRYQCISCGKWFSGTKRLATTEGRG